jgi:hypothetical protein
VVLGLAFAIIAPGLALTTAYLIVGPLLAGGVTALTDLAWPEDFKELGLILGVFTYATSLVTLPATVCFGLPLLAWFLHRGWVDWSRHALAGATAGALCWLIVVFWLFARHGKDSINQGGEVFAFLVLFSGCGALSASAYWVVSFGERRILALVATLCTLVVVLLLASYLAF